MIRRWPWRLATRHEQSKGVASTVLRISVRDEFGRPPLDSRSIGSVPSHDGDQIQVRRHDHFACLPPTRPPEGAPDSARLPRHSLDQALSETDGFNADIRKILDTATLEWGVEVTLVELKDIQLPDSMKRAMARQAEPESTDRLWFRLRVSLCGSSSGESVVEYPISLSGCSTWSFVSGVGRARWLGDERVVGVEHVVEQRVPRGFPWPVLR
jgi:hypothetical protein